MTPAGLIAASRLDPLGTAPRDIAVALDVPRELQLSDGEAAMTMAFRGRIEGREVAVETTVPLRLAPMDAAPGVAGPAGRLYVADLRPGDAARVRTAQREILAWRAAGATGPGRLSVDVTGGA